MHKDSVSSGAAEYSPMPLALSLFEPTGSWQGLGRILRNQLLKLDLQKRLTTEHLHIHGRSCRAGLFQTTAHILKTLSKWPASKDNARHFLQIIRSAELICQCTRRLRDNMEVRV